MWYTSVLNACYIDSWAILGSCIATFAVVFPSFILMVIISRFFLKYQKHPSVAAVFNGLRPGVVGLLAAAALVLMNAENFGSYQIDLYQFIISIIIFLVTFIGTRKYKINPILMIILCGVAGFLLYWEQDDYGKSSKKSVWSAPEIIINSLSSQIR